MTEEPICPLAGERLVTHGAFVTVKGIPGLVTEPAAFTTTLPVVAPEGTVAEMLVSDQLPIVANFPLKVTLNCVAPKLVPVMAIGVPIDPHPGDKDMMLGGGTTLKFLPLLVVPAEVVRTIFPLVVPAATIAVTDVEFHTVINDAGTPLKLTAPGLKLVPKPEPRIRTDDPIAPEAGEILVMTGCTVKGTPGLATPPAAVTTTFPVVAPAGTVVLILPSDHEFAVAFVPLNEIVPVS